MIDNTRRYAKWAAKNFEIDPLIRVEIDDVVVEPVKVCEITMYKVHVYYGTSLCGSGFYSKKCFPLHFRGRRLKNRAGYGYHSDMIVTSWPSSCNLPRHASSSIHKNFVHWNTKSLAIYRQMLRERKWEAEQAKIWRNELLAKRTKRDSEEFFSAMGLAGEIANVCNGSVSSPKKG